MLNIKLDTLKRENGLFSVDTIDGEHIHYDEMFPIECWDSEEAFKFAKIRGYEPMTAKELETEEQQDEKLNDSNYFVEEKFDGTRALVYFLSQKDVEDNEIGYCRVFSRRISKKTGFYVENTDSLPQIREINAPELAGTILDGEMFINGLPFKEVSSTLNCLWDKAVERQIEKGFISLHAFDILLYKGIDLRKMPLERRKVYLHLAVEEANCPYVEEVEYFECGNSIKSSAYAEIMKRIEPQDEDPFFDYLEGEKETYPNLYKCLKEDLPLTPRAYYEVIVSTSGEGVIVKPKAGKYLHKRGWEYSKIKKFLTKDLIILGFSEPTKEYTGKDVRKWGFWVEKDTDKRVMGNFYGDPNYIPVTKNYYHKQVGNLLLGVILTAEELNSIPKNKLGTYDYADEYIEDSDLKDKYIMEVCECAGFDDETRVYFTRNSSKLVGSVVEIKANELFKDSGKMRHPRFMRMRYDKNASQCTWEDHIGR